MGAGHFVVKFLATCIWLPQAGTILGGVSVC